MWRASAVRTAGDAGGDDWRDAWSALARFSSDAEVAEVRDECQRKDMEIAGMAEVVVQAAVADEAELMAAPVGYSAVVTRLDADLERDHADFERVTKFSVAKIGTSKTITILVC